MDGCGVFRLVLLSRLVSGNGLLFNSKVEDGWGMVYEGSEEKEDRNVWRKIEKKKERKEERKGEKSSRGSPTHK